MTDPDLKLDQTSRHHLVALITSPGFEVLMDVMRAEFEQFKVALINCDPKEKEAVLAAHNLTKAAGQYLTQIVNRLNYEKLIFDNYPRESDKPLDTTTLDLG